MIKTFKYKLYNSKNNKHLVYQIELASEIYNHCISLYKRHYKIFDKTLNKYELQKHLTKLKKLKKYSHWKNLGSQAIQDVTDRIERGYRQFFSKQAKNLPNCKKRDKYKSFTLKQAGYNISNSNIVTINKKQYKYFKSRSTEGTIKTLIVKRDNLGDLYLYVVCQVMKPEPIYKTGKTAGIDFGLKTFLTLSDNTSIENPRYLQSSMKKLKELHRSLFYKKLGSNNRRKARLKLAKLYIKISNQRRDFLFKLAKQLCYKYDVISVEDLDLESMKQTDNWGRKTSDYSYGEFLNILSYYCELTGKDFVKNSRWFPSSKMCSNCGWIYKDLTIDEREWTCEICKFEHDRDLNAAINNDREGTSSLSKKLLESHDL
jgi:putative transposase